MCIRDSFTSGFDFDHFAAIGMWFSIGIPNFIKVGLSAAELWRHSDFQDGGRQPCCIRFRAIVAHPRSASAGLCFALKFRLDRICSFGDRAIFIFWHWLEIAYSRPLLGVLGPYFPQMTSSIVVTQKALACTETRRLSHKAWKSVQRFDLGTGSRKKDTTGQDRTVQDSQKSHKGIIFYLLGEKSHWTDFHKKNCRVVAVPDVITNANFWAEIFRGYDFTGGRIIPFSY